MTLQEKGAALSEKLGKVKASGADEQVIRSWQPLKESLPERRERLERLVEIFRVLRSAGLLPQSPSVIPPVVDSLLETLPDLRDRLLNRPGTVMQASRWVNADNALKGAANSLETTLGNIWKVHVESLAPKLDDWLPFFRMDRSGEKIHRIGQLREELHSLAQRLPTNSETVEQANTKSTEVHDLVKKLDFGAIPPAVKKFIEQVTNLGGIPLHDLDQEVLDWLREKNLAQGFRVDVGGGQ